MHPLNRVLFHRCYEGARAPFSHPQIEVGDYTYGLRRDCFFSYHPNDKVVIGKFCGVAQGVKFIFGEHKMDRVSTYPFDARCFEDGAHVDSESKGDILIGNDVWIGANATLLWIRLRTTGSCFTEIQLHLLVSIRLKAEEALACVFSAVFLLVLPLFRCC